MARRQGSRISSLLIVAAALQCFLRLAETFVSPGAPALRGQQQQLVARRQASTSAGTDSAVKKEDKPGSAGKDDGKDVDDAVLRMAMAIAEEEETGNSTSAAASTPVEEEEPWFDFQKLLSVFWICIIIYSFGSAFIGVATGRLQDRSGGDFTAYDFFDNIFSFREWDLEYSLGFDPVKVWNSWTGKGGEQ
eukprot:TRINITY_DN113863_c0_g1_i1.p2 TRINITY_DN113863_c0_g1~~TRINITY_DN113863_c0_g1_i1.p2  ORF type:complete len:191 (+),score=78.57 TRINITY_DN113863_c0_g1_i1:80-652(+)